MALLGLSGYRLWIALGMLLTIVILFSTVMVQAARLDARAATIAAKDQQLQLAAADVVRWQQDAGAARGIVARQAEQIRRLEADAAAAAAIAAEQLARASARQAKLESQLDDVRRESPCPSGRRA